MTFYHILAEAQTFIEKTNILFSIDPIKGMSDNLFVVTYGNGTWSINPTKGEGGFLIDTMEGFTSYWSPWMLEGNPVTESDIEYYVEHGSLVNQEMEG